MSSLSRDSLPPAFREILTERDLKQNSTLQSFDRLGSELDRLTAHRESIDTILDVGCSRGGFAAALGKHLGADTVYGIDVDSDCLECAEERGLKTFNVDVESSPFPLEDESVDVVVSFGLLEHLTYYDTICTEISRVLRDGWFWVTTPNAASWVNRFALLTGYQPRNIEISREYAAGVLPFYDREQFLGHVHAPTYRALIELLEYYGFTPLKSTTLMPYQRTRLDAALDRIFSVRTGWGRRVSVLSRH